MHVLRDGLLLLLLTMMMTLSSGVAAGAEPPIPLPIPPAAEEALCFSHPPYSGIYGWSDDDLSEYMAVVAELTPWEPPPRRLAIVDGCVGFSPTQAEAAVRDHSWLVLKWPGVRRCFDGWEAIYGGLGDRGMAFTFEARGGCRSPVDAGPITLDRIEGIKWTVEAVEDERPEVRAAALERLIRDQKDPQSCLLLSITLQGYLRAEVPEPGPGVLRVLAGAEQACLAEAIEAAAATGAYAAEAAQALARVLTPEARPAALLRMVNKGGDGAVQSILAFAPYVPPSPALFKALEGASNDELATIAAAVVRAR